MSLSGKVALVTGGARGIGWAIVSHLLDHGASVAVCDNNKAAGEALLKEEAAKSLRKISFQHCDVSDDHQLEECFKKTNSEFSGLDIVVNNAGIGDETAPQWKRMIQINLVAAIRGTQLGMKYMGKDSGGKGGVVVNIGSTTCLEPYPSVPIYSSTKAALNQFSRSMGDELYFSKTGVRVVCLNPGLTASDLTEQDPSSYFPSSEVFQHFIKQISTLQSQSPDNIGRAVVEIVQTAQNGSLWSVENELPPYLTIPK